MQLVFTVDEFRLLVDVLLACERSAINSGQHNCPASALLQKALAHDLHFGIDELEDLEDVLKGHQTELLKNASESLGEQEAELRRQLALLEHVMDRVTEACAMA